MLDVAKDMAFPEATTIEEANKQRNHWVNVAAQYSRNADYYRGLLEECDAE